ncbi:hypothetical protein ABZZ74_50925 [Streptomyces sp. NPDC006476]|uniref:hypothetical protein n=1 Tax=Streptomyces sp. NPDC006476 TaxID=3157175 RepID=UPI0033B7ABA7
MEEFHQLLKCIATEKVGEGKTVVIAIDEVDRLGADTEALAFLREIKAILGVPLVHYLISVAEDVGAAFVRRGLPHRDVTDSSLDDIIHVQPSTLKESRAILAKRSQRLKDPHVMLAHALSGGILRDLLRSTGCSSARYRTRHSRTSSLTSPATSSWKNSRKHSLASGPC